MARTKQDASDEKKATIARKMSLSGKSGKGEGGTSPKKEWPGVKAAARDSRMGDKDNWTL